MNRLSKAHERYRRQTTDRRQTDGRAIAYSEREREFTFANKMIEHGFGAKVSLHYGPVPSPLLLVIVMKVIIMKQLSLLPSAGWEINYQPKFGDALWLRKKGRHDTFHLWLHVWMAGKTV